VYNLEIESHPGEITHNYFVGQDGVLVHNASKFGKIGDIIRFGFEIATSEPGPKDCDINSKPSEIAEIYNPPKPEFPSFGGKLPSPKYGPYGPGLNPYSLF